MSDPMKSVRRKRRLDRWWNEYRSCFRVYHGVEHVYLVHLPPWGRGTAFPVAWWPASFGRGESLAVLRSLGLRRGFVVKKPAQQSSERTAYAAPLDGIIDSYPTLAEMLTATAYDGDPPGTRLTSTLLIFTQDGAWKACLRDRQEQRCCWVATAFFSDLLATLDNALCDASVVWRDDRVSGHEQAKRQKPGK